MMRIRPDPDPQHCVSDQINGQQQVVLSHTEKDMWRICEVSHLGACAGEAVPHTEQPLYQLCHRLHGIAYAVLSDEQTKFKYQPVPINLLYDWLCQDLPPPTYGGSEKIS
jgi:hypothetical protein